MLRGSIPEQSFTVMSMFVVSGEGGLQREESGVG